jgi:hypothetical protein
VVEKEAAALEASLWHLDMAAIMGGPLLRPAVDGLIGVLQQRWQAVHGAATATAAAAAGVDGAAGFARQAQQEQQEQAGLGLISSSGRQEAKRAEVESGCSEAAEGQRAKRPRLAAEAGVTGANQEQAGNGTVLLPPGSLVGPPGSRVASAQLPSLEAFWQSYMSPGKPVLISGEWRAVGAYQVLSA